MATGSLAGKTRLLICGDRNWTNREYILGKLRDFVQFEGVDVECVIEGEARGADIEGRWAATLVGIPVMQFPADWSRYGRGAGPIRNQQMLDEGKPTLVWAFHRDVSQSKGTKDMVNRARRAGIKTEVFNGRD